MKKYSQLRLSSAISIGCALLINSSNAASSCNLDVDSFITKIPTSHGSFVNSPQSPALWSQAHYLRALVEIHQGYKTEAALVKLQEGINYILSKTSEQLGFDDVLRNASQPAWGSINYSCGHYSVTAVHTGVLSYPIVYFAKTVLSNPIRYSAYTSAALNFLQAAESAVDIHANQFQLKQGKWVYARPDNVSNLGVCYEDDGITIKDDFRNADSKILPYNMMLAMGLSHLELSRTFALPGTSQDLTKAAYHKDIAIKLANTFKSALNHISQTNSYQWEYSLGGRQEDIAHASLDIQFVMQMFSESLVFNNEDIRRLINTFELASADKDHIYSHVNKTASDKGTRQDRWQKGIVGWSALALVDREVAIRARDIFYRFDGGYKPNGSSTWYGEALLLKWKDPNLRFPMTGKPLATLPSYRPDYALRRSNITGLFRTPSMTVQTIDSKTVTSCAEYEFQNDQTDDLSIRYAHTTQTGSIDACSNSACGTNPGFHVFFANDANSSWQFGGSMSHIAADAYQIQSVASPLANYDKALLCRSGAGHARDNIGIRHLGIDTASCTSDYQDNEFNFSSMQNWVVGDQSDEASNLPKYSYNHRTGTSGRSNGFIEVSEPTNLSERVPSSNDPALGNLDIGIHQSFTHYDQGFSVKGWTRVTSRHAGSNKMNNRCVKALNANTGETLKSYCMHWENINDTGWRYFDFDFTPYVMGVPNVKIVIGTWDSWKANWRQHLRIDDVTVQIGSAP